MKQHARTKIFLFATLLLLVISIVAAVVSFFPTVGGSEENSSIIDTSFNMTPLGTWRQGLGSFVGGENISISVRVSTGNYLVNFTLLTYGVTRYSNLSTSDINYSFTAGADYYEAVFLADTVSSSNVHFQVYVQRTEVVYPFSWLATPAKALFFFSWGAMLLLISKSGFKEFSSTTPNMSGAMILTQKNLRRIQIAILVSLVFWLLVLAVNAYPLAAFENWYTDHARNPYSATLFTKVGFSIFNTPLGALASNDGSFYKFVTWPEMPNLYPLGSVFVFLPFGLLLENGVVPAFVFKMEIVLFLVVSHVCMYFFLKRFWKKDISFVLKALGAYFLYVVLVVYSANGQFDSVAFLFSIVAVAMFLESRYDFFLLFATISATFKYQAGIFLLPLVLVGLLKLFHQFKPFDFFKNKIVLAALGLVIVDLLTAYLSAPFLATVRPEFIMNGVNAFSPHAQVPWALQAFTVLLTFTVTLIGAVYLFNRSRLVSLFMVFSLLPCFTMPYFQAWYLPFFFVYPLFLQQRRTLEVTMVWLIFMVVVLSFGGIAFNPLHFLDNFRKVLGI